MTLSEYLESIYRLKKLRPGAHNTLRLYRSSIRNFEKTLGRCAELEDLTDDNIARLMHDIVARGGSAHTANKERSQLLAIWRFAARHGRIDRWPTVQAEVVPERVPQAWLAQDIEQLFATVDQLTGSLRSTRIPRKLWWRAILNVCLDTGERIGAVVQAEWNWVEHNWILFPAEVRKGKRRDRRFMISPATVRLLQELKQYVGEGEKIFFWPYSPTYLWNRYDKILKKANLPHGARDKFHRLRKTVASVAHACGLDAQELLDHQYRRTTQSYLDPRFTRQEQASTVLARYLADPSICHPGKHKPSQGGSHERFGKSG